MIDNLVAKISITITAPASKVWEALINPEVIKQYMFGTTVISDWKVGSSIVWKGIWQSKPYEDKGTILKFEPGKLISYSHFSPLAGKEDKPENYHTVTIELQAKGARTALSLSQDNNPTKEAKLHSEENWAIMLDMMKKYLEK
jgi:uncharacterized protein YndB with AHSA1/START domain